MTCSNCATELPEGAMFCGECGRAVSSTAQRASARQPGSPVAFDPIVELVEPAAAVETAGLPPEPETPLSVEPEAEPEAVAEPSAAAEPIAEPVVVDLTASSESCEQCGADLATTDIFCGECGFVRQTVRRGTRTDTAVLDPFPWGLPRTPAPVLPPEPAAPVVERAPVASVAAPADQSSAYSADLDETRIVDRAPRGDRFVLQFSTGESVSVTGTGLVGRNPVSEPGEYFDSFVTIVDPGKSVSKTHLEFGQDAGAFWISDRFSGNGTIVREPDGAPKRCDAGKRYRIVRGSRVEIGEQFFIVS